MSSKEKVVSEAWGLLEEILIGTRDIVKDIFSGITEVEWKIVFANTAFAFVIVSGASMSVTDISFKSAFIYFIISFALQLRDGRARKEREKESDELYIEKFGKMYMEEKKKVFKKLYGFEYNSIKFYILYVVFRVFRIGRYIIIRL